MRLYLAGTNARPYMNLARILYVLESFYYIEKWQVKLIPCWKDFILDSGAFSFMTGVGGNNVDFERYTYKYAEFIAQNNIKHFFELDIDSVAGLSKVEYLRHILERESGRRCIPVWHRSRGKQYFLDMCKEYTYVAIGGLVTKEITPPQYPVLRWFTSEARKLGTRVHGLGFTGKNLASYGFFSVDSTSWLAGARYGKVAKFDGRGMIHAHAPPGKRTVYYKIVDENNFDNWLLYQKYLDGMGD